MADKSSHDEGLIEADAREMMERYGNDALHAARLRQLAQADGEDLHRPPGHWAIVLDQIRRRQGPLVIR